MVPNHMTNDVTMSRNAGTPAIADHIHIPSLVLSMKLSQSDLLSLPVAARICLAYSSLTVC